MPSLKWLECAIYKDKLLLNTFVADVAINATAKYELESIQMSMFFI